MQQVCLAGAEGARQHCNTVQCSSWLGQSPACHKEASGLMQRLLP
jgi:hypothetical protein